MSNMDVVRIGGRPRAARVPALVLGAVAVAGLGTWAVPELFAHRAVAAPAVARDTLTIDTVTLGALERSVGAAGVLAPDRVHVVATVADGIIVDLPVRPGTRVDASTVIARLANPDLSVAVADGIAAVAAARADLQSARAEAAASRLDAGSALRSARAEDARASVEAAADTELHAKGLIGDLQYRSAVIKSGEDRDLVAIARSKITVGAADADAKVAASQARVDQLVAALDARRAQLQTLDIYAGTAGIVQSVAVDPGQRVTSGAEFARIAEERDLKAILQVAESDVRGVAPGMLARIAAGDMGAATGRVTRIAPAAQNGTVAVDVTLDRLPQGARADQNVDGTIVLRRLARALSIARPASNGDASRTTLYRLERDGMHADRTTVTFASGSDDRVRVVSGLVAGDRVIVSDTSTFDAPTLRITE